MEYLLDTCTLLWSLFDDPRLSKEVVSELTNNKNMIFVSTASLWEIDLKHNKHPELMPYTAYDIFRTIENRTNYRLLDLRPEHIFDLHSIMLEKVNNDPFDNILMSLAKNERLTLITHDTKITLSKEINTLVY